VIGCPRKNRGKRAQKVEHHYKKFKIDLFISCPFSFLPM
jgi:hypothetical protein